MHIFFHKVVCKQFAISGVIIEVVECRSEDLQNGEFECKRKKEGHRNI